MPELPEVITVIKVLKDEDLIGKHFVSVNVYNSKLLKNSTPKSLNNFLKNETVKDIQHKGKYIVFTLSKNKILVIHLRMEGKLFVEHSNIEEKKYLCVKFILNNNTTLRFYDSRMFGTIHIFDNLEKYNDSSIIKKIAIDPLDKNFTTMYLINALKNTNTYIKTALIDQSNVSGIGNIYVDEILFASFVSPLRRVKNVKPNEYILITKNAKKILKDAIACGGTTISTFESSNNHIGSYQNKLKIHGKKICPICKRKTAFTKVNGRGTTYCKYCQK
ncbi:MAG: DNA-formamidopyrimidine glycosylase [Mycoplasmataceae bacterium]|jgi:formamidopyrimidine-DNA glycosylase|nr:DNA-formamidopyrimidine glycosylase [Mycoplasmataceae bacterium]